MTNGSGTAQTVVFLARDNYDGPVTISLGADAPLDLTSDPLTIAAGGTAGTLVLHKGPSTPLGGPTRFTIVGQGNGDRTDDALLDLLVTGPSGTLDTTFGTGGMTTVTFAGSASAEAIVEMPDDSLVVGGSAGGDFALARLDADGAPVATFGSGGTATVDFAGGEDSAYGLVRQVDGKLVLAGTAATNGGFGIALARFTADGELDPTFGGDGRVTTSLGPSAVVRSLVQQDDGKLLAAGAAMIGTSLTLTLVRYETSGEPDATFGGGDGILLRPLGDFHSEAFDVTVRSDGLIIASGYSMEGGEQQWTVAYFEVDGSSLGPVPRGAVDGGTGHAVAWTFDGFIAAGTQGLGTPEGFIAGLGEDGQIDTSFGGGDGSVTFPGTAVDMTVQGNGRIVIAGGFGGDFTVCRATPGGAVDATFGIDGIALADFGAADDGARAVLASRDTRLLTVGVTDGKMAIARFWP